MLDRKLVLLDSAESRRLHYEISEYLIPRFRNAASRKMGCVRRNFFDFGASRCLAPFTSFFFKLGVEANTEPRLPSVAPPRCSTLNGLPSSHVRPRPYHRRRCRPTSHGVAPRAAAIGSLGCSSNPAETTVHLNLTALPPQNKHNSSVANAADITVTDVTSIAIASTLRLLKMRRPTYHSDAATSATRTPPSPTYYATESSIYIAVAVPMVGGKVGV